MVRKHGFMLVVVVDYVHGMGCVCACMVHVAAQPNACVCTSVRVARKLIDNKEWCTPRESWRYGGQTRKIENGLEEEGCSTKPRAIK